MRREALLLVLALLAPPVLGAEVRVSPGWIDLPTDEEGPPDVNPPFDLFVTRFNYPYTLRENLTGRQGVVRYRTLELENEYLRCIVLPDLGGHLYNCVDKANGADLFYANRSIRKARIGYRGAWAAYGVEFNFPVSHNWVSMSPVDYATTTSPDGSASVWVGNVDRVYGMQWRVELRLRPGSSLLEQHVALYNPSPLRRRFYWWNNAAVRVRDESRICYPMRWTASHGFREVDTWPVNAEGVDLSLVGHHLDGPVSVFSHGSREAFMGVYHPWANAGVVHYSSPEDAPTKKIWSFGGDADGLDWRRALSDDGSAYVEVQAGLFRNQETYAFLEPQESIRFTEYWMPVRGIGGITRANPEGALRLERAPGEGGTVDLSLGVNLNRTIRRGVLRLTDGAREVLSEAFDLTPAEFLLRARRGLPAAPKYTLEVVDPSGRILIAHTEGVYDYAPESEIRLGKQPSLDPAPPAERSDAGFVQVGDVLERNGDLLAAWETYRQGLDRFPESTGLEKAAGRLAVTLKRPGEAVPLLSRALARVSNDPEAHYYLGLAHAETGDEAKARAQWERAQILPPFRAASRLQLARLDAREGDLASALAHLRAVVEEEPDAVRAGGMEVAVLRHLGREDEARERLAHWRSLDPTGNLLRSEAVAMGAPDADLPVHLAGDVARVLDLAVEYMGLGFDADALGLLDRRYPTGPDVRSEPGAVAPGEDPLVAYYRGYCRERMGGSGEADYRAASAMSTRYVFPSRASTFPVLRAALAARPKDATALFLLGSWLLSGGRADEAIARWEEARAIDPRIPVLHRNLGLALLHADNDPRRALDVFLEGMGVDGTNTALYVAADQAQSLLGLSTPDHIAMLERFPDRAHLPPVLVEKLALALAEAGRGEEAEALFPGRYFPREENGTNVRQVYLEVRLRRAQRLAKEGRPEEAVRILGALDQPVPGLDFTRDGMAAFVEGARVQYLVGEVLAASGEEEKAREHWKRAVDGQDWPYLKPVYAFLAARRLGTADEAAWTKDLVTSLAGVEGFARRTAFPGIATYAQGLHLRALGREADARERFRQVFLLPDLRLSHFLSRRALEANDPF